MLHRSLDAIFNIFFAASRQNSAAKEAPCWKRGDRNHNRLQTKQPGARCSTWKRPARSNAAQRRCRAICEQLPALSKRARGKFRTHEMKQRRLRVASGHASFQTRAVRGSRKRKRDASERVCYKLTRGPDRDDLHWKEKVSCLFFLGNLLGNSSQVGYEPAQVFRSYSVVVAPCRKRENGTTASVSATCWCKTKQSFKHLFKAPKMIEQLILGKNRCDFILPPSEMNRMGTRS